MFLTPYYSYGKHVPFLSRATEALMNSFQNGADCDTASLWLPIELVLWKRIDKKLYTESVGA